MTRMGLGRPRDLEPQHRIFRRGRRIGDAVFSGPTVPPGLLAPLAGLLGVAAAMAVAFKDEALLRPFRPDIPSRGWKWRFRQMPSASGQDFTGSRSAPESSELGQEPPEALHLVGSSLSGVGSPRRTGCARLFDRAAD
jgi:hypothetical protein